MQDMMDVDRPTDRRGRMGSKRDLHTPLCDILGCRYPILQAGMGGVARSELVTAVTEAGGYGFLGMVRETPDLIAQEIDAVRARTDGPFGVNLIPQRPIRPCSRPSFPSASKRRSIRSASFGTCVPT